MLWQVMGALFVLAFTAFVYTESTGNPLLQAIGAEGLSWEGKDARFDLGALSLFSTVTTSASCGAVAVMHDSLMPLSGMVTMVLMQLGEVVFGGVGAGFYGMIVMAVIAVFIASLMVGRTPEYLGKKITPKEMKLAALTMLTGECQDFCVWGGYSRGSPTRLPFVFEMQYARPDAIAGAKVEGPARSAGGSSLAPAIARREAAGALAREV